MKEEAKALRITLFDFSAGDSAHTAEMVRAYFRSRRLHAEVKEFTEIQPFVLDFQARKDEGEPYDLAFVGVDNMMGAEAARHIRGMDDGLPLFLFSQVSDFGLEGYRLRALDYLTKPVSVKRVEEAIGRITSKCFESFRVPELLNGTQNSRAEPPGNASIYDVDVETPSEMEG